MEFEAALGQEALGVFGRTGLTPSQLAECWQRDLSLYDEERALRLGAEKSEAILAELALSLVRTLQSVLGDLDNADRLMGLYDISTAHSAVSKALATLGSFEP